MKHHRFIHRLGIVYHGQKIWVSELTSIFFVLLLSAILLTLSWRIIRNEYAIFQTNGLLATDKSDRIILSHYIEQLRDRVTITELLCSIAGRKLSPDILLNLSDIIYSNSKQYGYDPLLLLAVIQVESVFRPNAQGKYRSGKLSGAYGLMQLKMATAQEVASQLQMDSLTQEDLFKPEVNVVLGAAYLTTMISRFKSFKLGILAYNQGPGIIRKHLSQNSPLSVRYYRKVLRSYYSFKQNVTQLATHNEQKQLCR